MFNNLIFSSIKKIFLLLPPLYKKKSGAMLILLFLNSFLELFGLAAFVPLFSVIIDEELIGTNELLQWIYNTGDFSSRNQFILFLSGIIVLVVIIKNIVSFFILKSQAKFSLSLYMYFTIRLYLLYQQKGFAFFKETNSNQILQNLNIVTQRYANNLVLSVFNFLNEFIIIILLCNFLIIYDWKAVTLLLFSVPPVFFILYRFLNKRSVQIETETNDIQPIVTEKIFQSIFGFSDIEITNSQNLFLEKISKLLDRLVELSIKRAVFAHVPLKVMETAMVITVFILTLYGLFYLGDLGELSALLGLFALAAYRILPSINRIMIALISIKSYQYTFKIIQQVRELQPDSSTPETIEFKKSISIKDMSFRFPQAEPDDDILRNVNLTINKGESVGLVGVSGSGKTTLMNILLGFWSPTKGEILIDGKALNQNSLKSWRDQIGYVQQEVFLMDTTLAENIAFGLENKEIESEKLIKAIEKASLEEFVQSLPLGIDTVIGERGTKLSGGQRQRLGIARALYLGATVLFFDEATSALDSQTENEITEAIDQLSDDGSITIILIAHRITTLQNCNRIFEVGGGNVEEKENFLVSSK
jgi:ABC-type multidrug transport system fused ATPase/permease subunit